MGASTALIRAQIKHRIVNGAVTIRVDNVDSEHLRGVACDLYFITVGCIEISNDVITNSV